MRRHPNNPILTRTQIPDIPGILTDASSVFNPGAVKYRDRYMLVLRVQSRSRETFFVVAESDDGIGFRVRNEAVRFRGIERVKEKIYHIYDARITRLDGRFYIMFAADMEGICRLGLAKTDDFTFFEFLGMVSDDDNRNGVLFPERVNGKYLRLDRPNRVRKEGGPSSGNAIWLSESDDLLRWRPVTELIGGRFHYWDEFIGSGPPPIKTREGWLHIYHGVATHFQSVNIYQAGAMLLDLNDPSKVIGRCRANILEPREPYELTGQVPNVVFPSGMIVEKYDDEGFALTESEVKIYYGAADTSVSLAISTVGELLRASKEEKIG